MNNMKQLMKQAQKMQAQMAKAQEELGDKMVEATAGGGVVKVVANGHSEIKEIKIDPAAIDPDDVEMLEDLVLAAVTEAMRKAQEMASKEMEKITGGMSIPGMPGGLF